MIVPREHETPFNKAPVIRALAALLMVITILSAFTRIVTRILTVKSFKVDDALVVSATVVVVAQSIVVITQSTNGLGKLEDLPQDQISFILKSHYASDVLYIITLLLAKISATRTIWDMAPRERRRLILATEALIGVWAAASIFASLFQCKTPEPWNFISGQCFDRSTFWIVVDVFNIVTDLAITSILIEMFIKLKTSTSKKILVIGVFGCRIFIIPPIICHMYYYKKTADSPNPLFDMWSPVVIEQVIQCLSVMATCIPYLKPFMDSLESGQMAAGDVRGTRSKGSNSRSQSGYASHTGQTSRTRRNTTRGIKSITTMASNASHRLQKYEMMDMDRSRTKKGGVTTATVTTTAKGSGSWDGQSHTSQTVLVQQTWQVEVENKPKAPVDS